MPRPWLGSPQSREGAPRRVSPVLMSDTGDRHFEADYGAATWQRLRR
jgi:hypothetical protein